MGTQARIRDLAANRDRNAPQNRILDMNRGGHTAAPSFSGSMRPNFAAIQIETDRITHAITYAYCRFGRDHYCCGPDHPAF